MLTGDENIIDLTFSVIWRIADAPAYVFNVERPGRGREGRRRERHARGGRQHAAAAADLTTGRGQVQTRRVELMQQTLDS